MTTRTPTRTDLVDLHERKIARLQREATRANTLARAFDDYAVDVLRVIPTKGDVADFAARYLAEVAKEKADNARAVAALHAAEAAKLQSEGV